MSDSTLDRGIGGFSTVLLVVAGLMVAAGLVMPSAASEPPKDFRSLGGPAQPVRLVVPSLRIRAKILPIEVNQQAVLDPPEDPRDVGWWKRSARPGKPSGQTVLTGHTVHTGGGVMDDLRKLRRGNAVRVVTPKGVMVYRTTRVVTWSKAELAKRSVSIFEQRRDDNRLVLITCSGWTGSDYKDNVVVFAEPLGVRTHKA
jgi:LPXTG-site transpeptidase (sortase) family protein